MSSLRRAALGVALLFVANGLAVGVFGGSLPGLRALLGLGDGQVTIVLVTTGFFAVVTMNISGRIADRSGALVPSLVGGTVMVLALLAISRIDSFAALLVCAAFFGGGNGAMDVAMNALGVRVEQQGGRSVMSRLHACFSIGNLLGAGLVVLLGSVLAGDHRFRVPYVVAAVLVILIAAAASRTAPGGAPPVTHERQEERSTRIPPAAWLLAAMALCFGLTEGTAVDWSSIHVTDVAHVAPSTGAWGLACVSGLMVLVRLFGDAAVMRLGRRTVVAAGSVVAMAGYLLTATTGALASILVGWSLVGLGVGLIAPQIYGAAGHLGGGRVLALVVSFGYAAFLVGPAIIGFAAVHTDIQTAMLVPLVTAVALVVLSRSLPADQRL